MSTMLALQPAFNEKQETRQEAMLTLPNGENISLQEAVAHYMKLSKDGTLQSHLPPIQVQREGEYQELKEILGGI